MRRWNFRRSEDICWIKTNKEHPSRKYLSNLNQDSKSVLVRTKVSSRVCRSVGWYCCWNMGGMGRGGVSSSHTLTWFAVQGGAITGAQHVAFAYLRGCGGLKPQADPVRVTYHTYMTSSQEHCLMGIRGNVKRHLDGHIIHANMDTDVIVSEEPPLGSTEKPEELYDIIERFCNVRLGRGGCTIGMIVPLHFGHLLSSVCCHVKTHAQYVACCWWWYAGQAAH